ncbi:MAG: Lrp/AsnC family transcriptional regulator [Phenylobacterium sp.]|uniref:Lrp/AsnC family transcriptional regulator n=1 Tax=unclassified Phenylobacterium TaxID=2640670 RepID=UPI0008C8D46C|nr:MULTISPECIES: Lrp/AsnC family transcriptional regulator [unclassified Phenylobacterium]MBJ7411345.1 Lrp/AsnC family transcriptional regulator [Phenylobacterium sp.]OHB27414.1 MAG: AsnC family transcriptional regulator [Phenylobacterium sp. RIFCSPHIGHO2_01_FULL_69_31]
MSDDLDRRLIALLRADSRTPAASLAKTLKVSRGTIQNRIERLVSRGVIQGFTIRTRPDADSSRVRAVMTIAIEGERSRHVVQALKGFPEVAAVHTTNGRWDLVAELDVDTLNAFSQVLDRIREIEGIASTETSILLATQKL